VAGRDIWNKSVGSPRYGPCDKPTDGRQADDRLTDRLTDRQNRQNRTDRTEQTEQNRQNRHMLRRPEAASLLFPARTWTLAETLDHDPRDAVLAAGRGTIHVRMDLLIA
jgi:hypothetical protein